MKDLLQQYFEKKDELDRVTEELNMLKAELKSGMITMNEEVFEDDETGAMITYKEQERKTLDKKKVEQKLAPEVFNECFKTSTFSVLRVMSKEDRERMKSFRS